MEESQRGESLAGNGTDGERRSQKQGWGRLHVEMQVLATLSSEQPEEPLPRVLVAPRVLPAPLNSQLCCTRSVVVFARRKPTLPRVLGGLSAVPLLHGDVPVLEGEPQSWNLFCGVRWDGTCNGPRSHQDM